jgi:hypothetical protein
VLRRKLVLCRKRLASREFAAAAVAASATMISRPCYCLRTSIFAHRSADRSNACAYSKARQQDIVSPAPLAHQPAAEPQCKRRKPPTEFASPSHSPRANVTFHQNTALASVTSLPNLVTTGRNLGQIRPSWPGSSGNPMQSLFDCRNSRFRRDSVIPNRGPTGATKPFRRTREVFRKHWLPTFWCM